MAPEWSKFDTDLLSHVVIFDNGEKATSVVNLEC